MAEPSSKRRRLSPEALLRTEIDTEVVSNTIPETTTPTARASYRSPTKSSLARSHPNVLAKSPKRGSLTEPRGRLLRQELLGSRNSIGRVGPKSPVRPTRIAYLEKPTVAESTSRDGFAQAIAESFQDVISGQSTEEDRTQSNTRSPLHTRQVPNSAPQGLRHVSKYEIATGSTIPVPTLVKRPSVSARQPSENRNEPDLPPTPIQLGVATALNRPRGLASSSSIGSRSGSGRHRRRVREEGGAAITSSPLKPKARRPITPPDFSDVEEIEQRSVGEAPESDREDMEIDKENARVSQHGFLKIALPAALQEKQSEVAQIRAELELLRKDLTAIESLADELHQGAHLDIGLDTFTLLGLEVQNELEGQQSLASLASHPSFQEDPLAYLNLFAPANLHMEHETTVTQIRKRPEVIQKVTLTAPAPWPAESLLLSFAVRIDAENARIEQVTEIKSRKFLDYGNLHRWIEARLESPLHKFDLGSMTWGIGQYFKSCIQRAEVFKAIDERYNNNTPNELLTRASSAVHEKVLLGQYLHETQLVVSRSTAASQSEKSSEQILISYNIDLTWTGDTTTRVDISLSGISGKAQKGAKELFQKLVIEQGVIGALDAVWHLLRPDQSAQGLASSREQKIRTQKAVIAN